MKHSVDRGLRERPPPRELDKERLHVNGPLGPNGDIYPSGNNPKFHDEFGLPRQLLGGTARRRYASLQNVQPT